MEAERGNGPSIIPKREGQEGSCRLGLNVWISLRGRGERDLKKKKGVSEIVI